MVQGVDAARKERLVARCPIGFVFPAHDWTGLVKIMMTKNVFSII